MSELIKEIEHALGYDMIEEGNMTTYDVLEIVKNFKQPELDDNQQIVLDWLKNPFNDIPNRFVKNYFAYIACLVSGRAPGKVLKAYRELSPEQQLQVLSAFAQWGLEQEDNDNGNKS